MIKQPLAKRGPIDFMRLGYMRPSLAPEVVAALVEYSERLQLERDAMPPTAAATTSDGAAARIDLSATLVIPGDDDEGDGLPF